jgi:CBS domain-containing protein
MRAGVPSVDRADRLVAAAALMHRRGVTALAVVDGERLAGIISDSDVLRAVADGLSTDALLIADYLAAAPCTIDVADEAAVAVRRMIDHGVRHLPVVSAGRVVGVISACDLVAAWGVPAELLGC